MVKVVVEVQPFKLAVTVITDETDEAEVLVVLNDGIFPVPDAASPIDVLEFVQLMETPAAGVVLKLIAPVASPWQSTLSDTA